MSRNNEIRIDKFLWAVRIFKTRSIASDACRKGKILINDIQVKPSRIVSINEMITVKKLPVIYTYRIIQAIENRVGAKMIHLYIDDITPETEKTKLINREIGGFGYRDRGTGRPTKRERRNIDRLINDLDNR
jgi:ribosome-associated heat shock protein Hsp15